MRIMGFLKSLADKFSSSQDQASDLDFEIYNGLVAEFEALSFCIEDLCLDKEIRIERIINELNPNQDKAVPELITKSQELLLQDYAFTEGMDQDEVAHNLNVMWLPYYARALGELVISAHKLTEETAQQAPESDAPKSYITEEMINDLNDTLSFVNGVLYKNFLSFMHYTQTEMPVYRIIDCVAYAKDNGLTDGHGLTDWFPRANVFAAEESSIKRQHLKP